MVHFGYCLSCKIASNHDMKTKRVSVISVAQLSMWQRSQPNVSAADKDPTLDLKALHLNYLVVLFNWTLIDTMLGCCRCSLSESRANAK